MLIIFDNTYYEPSKQALAKKTVFQETADFQESSYFFGRFRIQNK